VTVELRTDRVQPRRASECGYVWSLSDPLEGVNEADRVEQAQDLDGGGTVPDGPIVSLDQATEADALEQGAAMNDDDGFTH
jgi:hypothetical protein